MENKFGDLFFVNEEKEDEMIKNMENEFILEDYIVEEHSTEIEEEKKTETKTETETLKTTQNKRKNVSEMKVEGMGGIEENNEILTAKKIKKNEEFETNKKKWGNNFETATFEQNDFLDHHNKDEEEDFCYNDDQNDEDYKEKNSRKKKKKRKIPKKESENTKNKKDRKKISNKFSFSYESLGNLSGNYFAAFIYFMKTNLNINDDIDDKFLESKSILDCTIKYIDYVKNSEESRNKSKKQRLTNLRLVLKRILDHDEIKIDKNYILLCIDLITEENDKIHINKNETNLSNQTKTKTKTKSKSKTFSKDSFNSGGYKFSFSMNSLGKNSIKNFSNFKNFLLKKILINEEINDSFLQNHSLVDYVIQYIQFVDNKNILWRSKKKVLRNLKSFFEKIVNEENIKFEKKFLILSIDEIDNFKTKPTEKKEEQKEEEKKIFIDLLSEEEMEEKKVQQMENKNPKKSEFEEDDIFLMELELESIENEIKFLELMRKKQLLEMQLKEEKKNFI